jgi:3,4-dihydroxy 2-butanone 4-phosphate synthase/GTP cyclohydrolase II
MQTVPLAFEEFRRGGIVLLLDPAGQGNLAVAANLATATTVAFMARVGTGHFSLAVKQPEDAAQIANPNLPEWEIACVGISAPSPMGVAETALDLARMAGCCPCVLLAPLRDPDGAAFAALHRLPALNLQGLNDHRSRTEAMLDLAAEADLPTPHADHPFRVYSFKSQFDGTEHLALVSPGTADGAPLVRIHSECLTGDAFGSLRCDCGPQLDESLRKLGASPGGILIYMRGHEGRGIGLTNKMRAYALQDQGMDTVEANRALGLPEDARDFAHAAQILRALGHDTVRLLTNNPEKAASLQRHGITVAASVALIIPPNPFNSRYLHTKAEKFGHALPFPSVS